MMRPGVNDIKHPSSAILYLKTEGKALMEALFTSMLGYGKAFMLLFDLVLLTSCLCIAGIFVKDRAWVFTDKYLSAIVFFNLLWIFLSYLRGIHKDLLLIDATDIFRTLGKVYFVFSSCSLFFILILLDGFNNIESFFKFLVIFYSLFGGSLIVNRIVLFSIRKRYKDKIRKKKNILIIGDSSSCELLESYIEENQCDLRLRGCFNNSNISINNAQGVIRGKVEECVKYFDDLEINEIYCSLQGIGEETATFLIKEADKHMIRIKFLPDFYQIFRRRSTINYLGSVPVVSIRTEPLTIDKNIIIKRIFDFCFSLLVIIFLLSWLAPIIGLAIKLESKGPIFFKQKRSGFNNRPFWVYKFRSMKKIGGIKEDSQVKRNDVRITRIGAFLRRTSLDELPQFINVIFGHMSVVGPRPHMIAHTEKFSEQVEAYMVRHFAKPGITGWAQVNGYRGETKNSEAIEGRVQHDVWYIENWSLTFDFKVIFLTVWNIIKGEKNAF